jgi:hypothetical protein
MIARWFRDTFYIYRRFDAANWAASPWTYVTSFRGFIQPAGASLATKNGAANPSAMFTIYWKVFGRQHGTLCRFRRIRNALYEGAAVHGAGY